MPNKRIIDIQDANVGIMEAVETLADIAELNFDNAIINGKKEEIVEQNRQVCELTAKILHLEGEDPDVTVKALRDTFHTVYDYIQNFYKKDYRQTGNQKAVEGVKTIMVIVGEAVQRLDKYTTLFNKTKEKSVANLKEYKQLQDFYLTRIARKIDQGVLGKWILELAKDSMFRNEGEGQGIETTTQTKHIFIDLVTVKKDTEYELFFLKKEDGTRFFSPKLIRNIKLVCDFEGRIGKNDRADPFESLQQWEDRLAFETAKHMVRSAISSINNFFHETKSHVRWDIVRDINKALMALLLCSNPKNLMRNSPVKTSFEYFNDFLGFLRESMLSREYNKWIAYPPEKSNKLAHTILEIIHSLCQALMSSNKGALEISDWLTKLLDGVELEYVGKKENTHFLWSHLLENYAKMSKLMKMHPNGPLIKVLEIIKNGGYYAFDPISQYNIPDQLYSLYSGENKMTNLRIPSPTFQEHIHKALVIEEFKGFLRSYNQDSLNKNHLMINLQDRTSWREHFRSRVLEELQNHQEFQNCLTVVSVSKDTDFYEQSPPYQQENHADIFIEHFKEQLADENCGFYFPRVIKKELFPNFVEGILSSINKVFFSEKNVLTVNNRRDFIELFYLFLVLKILEVVKPDTFSLTCKDGVDVGGAFNVQLYAFMKIINGETFKFDEINKLNAMLQLSPLFIRERAMHIERFNRLLDVLKLMEHTQEDYGAKAFQKIIKEAFGKYYNSPILNASIVQ
jgi:hypothetical protein